MESERNEKGQFEWLCGNGPVFPIDYTQRSFAEYLGGDPRLVKRYLVAHPFFRDILQEQFCGSQRAAQLPERSDNAPVSIPVESAVFFDCFYALVTGEKYHAAFCSGRDNIPKEKMAQFIHDLCQELRLKIEDDSVKGNPYCRHALYENRTFRKEILSDLWERELDKRSQKIRELSKTATMEAQLNVLMDCVLCLDRNILNLSLAVEENIAPSGEDAIRSLLLDLLQRERETGTSAFASYLVDDIALQSGAMGAKASTLQEAFIALSDSPASRKNSREDLKNLKKCARQSYLGYLDDKGEEQGFERQYRSADQYLHVRNTGVQKELLQRLVTERCKRYWIPVLAQCRFEPDCSMSPIGEEFSSLRYAAQLVDHLVSTALYPCRHQYADTIRLSSYFHMAACFAAQNDAHTRCVLKQVGETLDYDPIAVRCPIVEPKDNSTFLDTVEFSKMFSCAWKNIYGEDVFDPETKHFLDPEQTARRIYKDGRDSAAYFGREQYFPFALKGVQKMMSIYEEIISYPERFYAYTKLLNFVPELLIFALMNVFRREAEVRIRQITDYIGLLFPSCAE
ncbi:MAG: hypothetical protein ACI3W8_00405 [Oscillospiraceae bacterium]